MNDLSYHSKYFWWSCPTVFPQTYAIESVPNKTSRADVSGHKCCWSEKELLYSLCPITRNTILDFFVFFSFTNTWLFQFSKMQSSIAAGKKKGPSPEFLPPGQLTGAICSYGNTVTHSYSFSSKQRQIHKLRKFSLHCQMLTCTVLFTTTD